MSYGVFQVCFKLGPHLARVLSLSTLLSHRVVLALTSRRPLVVPKTFF